MSNSSIICKAKNKIIKEFVKDKDILLAIDSKQVDINTPEKFVYTHLFDYHQNPHTLNDVITFITIQVHIPSDSFIYGSYDRIFIKPQVEIWIVSHEKHMKIDNIPKVKENRNDYISELIDRKLNGRSDFGIGELKLAGNTEGAFTHDYVYRRMVFEGTDVNNTMCVNK